MTFNSTIAAGLSIIAVAVAVVAAPAGAVTAASGRQYQTSPRTVSCVWGITGSLDVVCASRSMHSPGAALANQPIAPRSGAGVVARAVIHSCTPWSDMYDIHATSISCSAAKRVLRRVARTSCVVGHVCTAGGFTYRLSGPRQKTIGRRGKQRISWRSTFAD